jgi:ABC-type transport system involved in cytochrome bd biosynthesis fused ATPase/permease subunit
MESLFEGTYLDNITFNDKDITQDLKWALDGVQLGSFIKSLQSLDSHIFPEGRQLSSNAQKILLARSIHKPKIYSTRDPTDTMDEKFNEIMVSSPRREQMDYYSFKKPLLENKCNRNHNAKWTYSTGLKKNRLC